MPGVSATITVRSIVGRFLEHSRIFYFENACQPLIYVGSADWMPRNFFRRIEVVFPIQDGVLRDRIKRELLDTQLADNVKARILRSDGSYHLPPVPAGETAHHSQEEFIALVVDGTRTWKRTRRPKRKYPQVKLAPRPHRP
jgi:polyphosphate kinase